MSDPARLPNELSKEEQWHILDQGMLAVYRHHVATGHSRAFCVSVKKLEYVCPHCGLVLFEGPDFVDFTGGEEWRCYVFPAGAKAGSRTLPGRSQGNGTEGRSVMPRKHERAPEKRLALQSGDEPLEYGDLLIRFMERVIAGVVHDPELSPHYSAIRSLLSATVQDELKDFAFDYAYELYSDERVIRRRRRAFEENAAEEGEERRR